MIIKALLTASVGGASAQSSGPGTPGQPNCAGQTTAWIAQTFGGFAHAAALFGVSVQQLHQVVDADCVVGG